MNSQQKLPILKVFEINGEKETTLQDIIARESRPVVLDLWHTNCQRCPAALSKLNEEASKHPDILFIACALSVGDGNRETVIDVVSDWEDLLHVFMEIDQKEVAKAALGFSSVPFYVVLDKNGMILAAGEPKTVDFTSIIDNANKAPSGGLVLDADF